MLYFRPLGEARRILRLSILYLRCRLLGICWLLRLRLLAFNSLFEMLEPPDECVPDAVWRPFNSLFEMLHTPVSIFVSSRFFLSILYLRCVVGVKPDGIGSYGIFQFSI